jgi:hypothetical protein
VIDLKCGQMSLTDIGKVSRVYSVPPAGQSALTVFTEGEAGHSSLPSQKEARRTDEKLSAGPQSELTVQQDKFWLFRTTKNVTIAPRCRQIVLERLESEKGQSLPPLVCVEPTQTPIEAQYNTGASLSKFRTPFYPHYGCLQGGSCGHLIPGTGWCRKTHCLCQ